MVMPNDRSPIVQPKSENGSIHLHPDSCTHNSCNETSLSATSHAATEHLGRALQAIFEHPVVEPSSWQIAWLAPERQSPDLQPFDPLSVTLRI